LEILSFFVTLTVWILGGFMAVMTDLFKRILGGQVVRYVSVLSLDDVFKDKKPREKKLGGAGRRIEYEITDDGIVLTAGRDSLEKETVVVPLADDLSFGTRPIGEEYKLPPDAPCFRMEIFNGTLKLATTLDFVDAGYVDKAL
jgi:hypothetical protein